MNHYNKASQKQQLIAYKSTSCNNNLGCTSPPAMNHNNQTNQKQQCIALSNTTGVTTPSVAHHHPPFKVTMHHKLTQGNAYPCVTTEALGCPRHECSGWLQRNRGVAPAMNALGSCKGTEVQCCSSPHEAASPYHQCSPTLSISVARTSCCL
eukprot:1157461-Pelagomonas_calceolata.AAC.13